MNAKLFRTDKNELVLVFQNANEGWQFCIFRFLTNGKIDFVTASKINLTTEIIKYITAIFGKQKYIQSTCPTNTFINLTLEEDVSILMLKSNVTPFNYHDKDIKGVVLKDYITEIANNPNLVMKDIEKQTYQGLPKRVIDSEKVWGSKYLDQNNLDIYKSEIGDDLYKIKLKNKKFQFIIKYIEFNNPINPYKNILLSGPAGNGKTTNAEAIAKHFDLPYAALVCDPRMEATDAGGVITVKADDKGQSQWIQHMTDFLKVAKSGGVVSLEEISLAPGATQSAWNAMLNGTVRYIVWQGETHLIHPDTIFFATRNIGYEGNSSLNFSFKDRFLKMYIPLPSQEEIRDYLSVKFSLPKTSAMEYVKFCFKLDQYLRDHHSQDDMYSNERPEITLRLMNEMLAVLLNYGVIEEPLTEILRGIFDSPSYTDSTVQNVINVFTNDIQNLEKILFVDSVHLTEADKMYQRVIGLQHSPSSGGTSSSAKRQTKSLSDMLAEFQSNADGSDDVAAQASSVFDAFKEIMDEDEEEGGE